MRSELIQAQFNSEENLRLNAVRGLGHQWSTDYTQVPADIIAWSASPYYEEARIDKGTNNGVIVNSPVLANSGSGPGLAGIVTQAGPISATIAFLSQPQTSVGVTISTVELCVRDPAADRAGRVPDRRHPGQQAGRQRRRRLHRRVRALGQLSIYPRGIPVGVVEGVGHREADVQQTVQVVPFVTSNSLAYVVALAPKSALAKQRATTP